jgi:hypothetical protein
MLDQVVGAGPNFPVVESNDFIGNDPEGGCGLLNNAGLVWATNNFWAAAADFGVTQQVACNGPTIVDPPKLQPH